MPTHDPIRRRPVLWMLWLLLMFVSLVGACNEPEDDSKPETLKEGQPVWINHLTKREPLALEDVHGVMSRLKSNKLDTDSLNLPEAWTKDTRPTMLLLHAGDAKRPSNGVLGRGKGLVEALKDAAKNLKPWIRTDEDLAYLRLELITAVKGRYRMNTQKAFAGKWFNDEAYGLAFDAQSGVIVTHDELTAFELVNDKRKVNMERFKNLLSERPRSCNYGRKLPLPEKTKDKKRPEFRSYVFTSQVFVSSAKGTIELANGQQNHRPTGSTRHGTRHAIGGGNF